MAQLRENLGHFAHCHKDLLGTLARSALTGQDHRHTGTWPAGCSCGGVEVALISHGLGQAAPGCAHGCTLSSGPWWNQRKLYASILFLAKKCISLLPLATQAVFTENIRV